MSIHANLSEEAQARLHAQRRNSTVVSIVISILVVLLIALVLGIFLLPKVIEPLGHPEATYQPPRKDEIDNEPPVTTNRLLRNPTPPASSPSSLKALAAQSISVVSVPVPNVVVTAPSLDYGDREDFGPSGISAGFDGGPGFEGIRPELRARCSRADRMARLLGQGGIPECEDAVVEALNWLKATQNPDGSWDRQHPVAMTGFALLAFLGHCETPQSPEYGETVLKGITYLINIGLKNDGRLTNKDAASIQWVYDHGIATYALAESYTFCSKLNINIPNLDTVTKRSGDMIMQGQGESGGWVYKFDSTNSGDNSVGFWQIQALKACKHTGLWPMGKFTKVAREALGWLDQVQGKNGAIGYRNDPGKSPGLTGGGVLAFQMWDKGSSRNAKSGIRYISKNSDFEWGKESSNLYYHYYNAQAMINHGGREWEDYNLRFRDILLNQQNADGSWSQGGVKHGPVNTHMATCLATLMLEVYYRFLPGTGSN